MARVRGFAKNTRHAKLHLVRMNSTGLAFPALLLPPTAVTITFVDELRDDAVIWMEVEFNLLEVQQLFQVTKDFLERQSR